MNASNQRICFFFSPPLAWAPRRLSLVSRKPGVPISVHQSVASVLSKLATCQDSNRRLAAPGSKHEPKKEQDQASSLFAAQIFENVKPWKDDRQWPYLFSKRIGVDSPATPGGHETPASKKKLEARPGWLQTESCTPHSHR